MKACMVVPIYLHADTCGQVLDAAIQNKLFCILVDDGNAPGQAALIKTEVDRAGENAGLVRLEKNQGKGAAVEAGCRRAFELGYTHALQIDADGQHDSLDIPRFIDMAKNNPTAVIVGWPQFDQTQPLGRRLGRHLTHVWVWINTLSFDIRDSICGFRIYPLDTLLPLLTSMGKMHRMDFDPAVLVRLHWEGIAIRNIETRVKYPPGGVSGFLPILDNFLISRMHAILFFGMLIRMPRLLWRKLK